MAEPLIQMVQAAQTELGLPVATAVMGSSDNTARQFGALASRVGKLLLRMHDWTSLTREWHVTVPAPIVATGVAMAAGDAVIGNVPPAVTSQLLPYQMIVSGPGIMTATRLIAVNVNAWQVTLDQPVSINGYQTISFNQDWFSAPDDWSRSINQTQWDRSMRWPLMGPMSPQSDQWVRSGIVATGPRRQFRTFGSGMRIWPVPYGGVGSGPGVGGGQLITEYVSRDWVLRADNTTTDQFYADHDSSLFDDDVMITGIKYLFFRTKGFDYTMLETDFQRAARQAIAMDGPSQTLDMSTRRFPVLISPANAPDASVYGSPSGSFNIG